LKYERETLTLDSLLLTWFLYFIYFQAVRLQVYLRIYLLLKFIKYELFQISLRNFPSKY